MISDISLKAKIRNISKEKNISAQSVLQNYLMNRFLYRLSKTSYKDKFVIKGGMLIASIAGIENRSTMDLDATLRNIPLTEESIRSAFETICRAPNDDGIEFIFDSIEPIRDDDKYGGYRVSFSAVFGKINAPMSMDISTGDIITPGAKTHIFSDIVDGTKSFELLSYPVETVLAEKVETILSRGTENTRPRDFYDVYKLSTYSYDKKTFKRAFEATARHRESIEKIKDYNSILKNILDSEDMNKRWKGYEKLMPYVKGIDFKDTIDVILEMFV